MALVKDVRIDDKLKDYARVIAEIEAIKAELPQLADLEKSAEEIKKVLQEYAKENGEVFGSGYGVTISTRESWDTKKLPGFAVAHPELNELKSITVVATVKKLKGG